ncbi:nucleobase:cation symporter-2 family protein [Bacillus thermotolerans]|uniref:nucleobase:cation symporter-2 family protein n=1 Tax=Bacillus thermotolerans TaxID=1221996 RepID=UPI00057C909A|nr:nucleobase:cation symporter-2 family protein [Bacillus thermotolerans]KKB38504.1 Xanthine permease [Bacillus thermotolerans]
MKLSFFQTASLGIQHVLAMYAGAVIIPLIVGGAMGLTAEQLTYLVSIDLFTCGLATFLQVWKGRFIGIGLPVVLGCTFTAIGPMIAIGGSYGISAIYGATLAAGVFVLLISTVFSQLVRFFPPVVTGSVVTVIGLTLVPEALKNLGGGAGSPDFGSMSNIFLGFITLLIIIALFRFFKGFVRAVAVLIGLLAGTAIAAFMGKIDFSPVQEASYFHVVQPFYFGMPTFEWSAIITMILVAIVSLVESTGVYFAVSDICDKKLEKKDLAKGYRAEGLAYALGAIFNAFPYTAFSQNVGLMQMSGVKSRAVIFYAAVFLMLLGLVPKIGAFTTIIPTSVLGGAMIAMFGMVVAQGIKMLSRADMASQENLLIIACSVGMGLGVTVVPDLFASLPSGLQILTSNGIVAGSMTAIILNIVFNEIGRKKSSTAVELAEQKVS